MRVVDRSSGHTVSNEELEQLDGCAIANNIGNCEIDADWEFDETAAFDVVREVTATADVPDDQEADVRLVRLLSGELVIAEKSLSDLEPCDRCGSVIHQRAVWETCECCGERFLVCEECLLREHDGLCEGEVDQ
jgi:hypothetical protein